MYTMPVESPCIDPWTMPDIALAELLPADLLDFELPTLEDLDVEDLLADMNKWMAELPTFELEKLLEDLKLPDLGDMKLQDFTLCEDLAADLLEGLLDA
jgi:hypothetical protein